MMDEGVFDHGEDRGKALIDVLKGRRPWRRPVWFMRQAGRYLEEYRATRAQAGSFLDLCYSPELAAEVTLQPLRRFDLDAAILFADILLVPQAMGVELGFRQNEGPVLAAVRDMEDVRALRPGGAAERLSAIYETVERIVAALPPHVALIGFCGAPWTVATYMVEGGGSPERLRARMAAARGQVWLDTLIDMLVEVSTEYLARQVQAGAEAVQIFDTWAGDLGDGLRERYVIDPVRRIVEGLRARGMDVPVIGFARGLGAAQLQFARETGVQAVGCEWSLPVSYMAEVLAPKVVVQGNLDPLLVVAGDPAMREAVERLVRGIPRERHIFNLGHGFKPETPVAHVEALVRHVRELDAASGS
jgi:uroporphyrinogen decarboxylase